MPCVKKLSWAEPLEVAAGILPEEECWALLYSGMRLDFTGRYSLLALFPKEMLTEGGFSAMEAALSAQKGREGWQSAWFGYFGYGLKNMLERLPEDSPASVNFPDMCWVHYHLVLVFDHEEHSISAYADEDFWFSRIPVPKPIPQWHGQVGALRSNMSKAQYLEKVGEIKEALLRGDIYQANLTRKFFGEIEGDVNSFALFARLVEKSPAPYSAYLTWQGRAIVSSSPERFLSIDTSGMVETRPIKGSAPRHKEKAKDAALSEALQASDKDRAENLMIVDLARNDLSRGCVAGSVEVPELFGLTSYATVHHLSSVVRGIKRSNISSIEVISDCFPPASMTGTPKIKAMEICSRLEKQSRGVYSGALGWLKPEGAVDLSVVIRTVLIEGKQFEFQVGGAIIADSHPITEWEETLTKAAGVAGALGVDTNILRNI